jgi:YbbR domain-containing protein
MIRLLTKNLGWKLLSLAISILLWIAVAREPELATDISVPIEFKNIPEDVDISSGAPDRVHVEIRGPSGRLTPDYLSGLAVVLDLSDVRPGERTLTIRGQNLNLPAGVEFYRAVPTQITLRLDRLQTRSVKVLPRYSKSPPDGYRIESYQVEPAKVGIRGPQDHVSQIDHVMTDPIDLSSVVSRTEIRVHVNVGDPQVRLESPAQVTVRVQLARSTNSGT